MYSFAFKEDLKDKVVAVILGGAIGGALGAPFETMNIADIARLFDPNEFAPPSATNRFLKGLDLKPGSWTDDTKMTMATLEAFIESGGRPDMDIIAKYHVAAFKDTPLRGWGKSTTNACERLASGTHWSKSGEPNGMGDGVMMKSSVFGLWGGLTWPGDEDFNRHFIPFGCMTHLGVLAVVGGAIHARAVGTMLNINDLQLIITRPAFFDFLTTKANSLEIELSDPTSNHLKISGVLERVRDLLGVKRKVTPLKISKAFNGATCYTPSAFGAVYATFLNNPESFDAVYDMIRTGGDTDSTAKMVGELLGALHGTEILPTHLLENLEAVDMLRARAERFFDVVWDSRR